MFRISEELKQQKLKSELPLIGKAGYHLSRSWLFDSQLNSNEKLMSEEEVHQWRINRIVKERQEKKLMFTKYKSPFIKETIKKKTT